MNINRNLLFVFIAWFTLNGCTRDDICDENTATTPLLVITFKDSSNPLAAKSVANLTVETIGSNSIAVISQETTDSIAIPLRTNLDLTEYRFISDDGGIAPNTDFLNFNYTREDEYVNRACAFRTIYNDLSMQVQDEGTANWIVTFTILNTTIENETSAHITILH